MKSPFGILAGLALVAGVAAASTLTASSTGLYSGLTVRIEEGSTDPDGDCSDVLDNLEVGQRPGEMLRDQTLSAYCDTGYSDTV